MRTKKISARWTRSENKTILEMKKSGCLWKEIHDAPDARSNPGAVLYQAQEVITPIRPLEKQANSLF